MGRYFFRVGSHSSRPSRIRVRVILQAVIQLIKGIGCEVVAEAVETAAQADILRAMGCDTVQGFVFAPAMFEDEFVNWTSNAVRSSKSVA